MLQSDEKNYLIKAMGSEMLSKEALEEVLEIVRKNPENLINPHSKPCNIGKDGTLLHWAVAHQHHSVLAILLQQEEMDPNIKTKPFGYTPLHLAVAIGNTEAIHWLLSHPHTNPNALDKDDTSPLHLWYAMQRQDEEILKLLLKHEKTDINAQNAQGNSLLHKTLTSCNNGGNAFFDLVELLFRFKKTSIDFNLTNNEGNTLLHMAIPLNNFEIVHLLIANGAKQLSNQKGETPLHLATKIGNQALVKLLLESDGAYTTRNDGDTPLHIAIKNSRIPLVAFFLDNIDTMDINAQNSAGNSPLHCAIQNNQMNTLYLLEQRRAATNLQNNRGDTVLHLIAQKNHRRLNECIVYYMKNNNHLLQNQEGNTPLHLAVLSDNFELLTRLVKDQNTIDIQNNDGDTPLHLAVKNNKIETAKILMARGKCSVENNENKTAADLAAEQGCEDIFIHMRTARTKSARKT